MKFVYEIEDLDCAHCAAKIEKAIAKIAGVESVSVSFLAQKMTLEADERLIGDIMKRAVAVCKRIEPDCSIVIK